MPGPARPAARLPQRPARRLAHRQAPRPARPTAWRQIAQRAARPRTSARSRRGSRRSRCRAGGQAGAAASPAPLPIACGGVRRHAARAGRIGDERRARRVVIAGLASLGAALAGARRRRRLAQPPRRRRGPAAPRRRASPPAPRLLARGAYLARAGNCVGCHTARGGAPYAGGRGIETPFGTVYASQPHARPGHRPRPLDGRRLLARAAPRPLEATAACSTRRSRTRTTPGSRAPTPTRSSPTCRACRRSRRPNRAARAALPVRHAGGAGGLARALLPARRPCRADPAQLGRVEPRRLPGRGARPLQRLPRARATRSARPAARSTSPAA